MAKVLKECVRQNFWNTQKQKINIMINFDEITRENTEEHNPH